MGRKAITLRTPVGNEYERYNFNSSDEEISKMKKHTIFLYHLAGFILGSVGIVAYVFYHLSSAGVGGIIAMPAIALVYVVALAILCIISLLVFLLIAYIRS